MLLTIRTVLHAFCCLLAAIAVSVLAATDVQAAAPSLGSISPIGAQRGTEVEVTLNGARLTDAQDLFFYYPGISLKQMAVVNDNSVKATLTIAPDCRIGIHAVRLRSASGISELRTFMVGSLPDVAEVEDNSDFTKPQAIELDCTVNGVAQNEDVDYYMVTAKKGERISAEVEGIRLGVTFFDPYVAIMDMGRFELASSDDSALIWQDGVVSIIAPEDGNYIIQIRESSYGGNGACFYRLHVGRFPRPLAVSPAGGKVGETVTVKMLGDVTGELTQQFTLPGAVDPSFGIFANDPMGIAPSPNAFRVTDLDNAMEVEPNNSVAEATVFEAPRALNGVIEQAEDIDFFKFTGKAGQAFDIRVHARGIRSPLDPVLVVYNAQGGGLASNDDSGGPDSYLRFGVPADGEYLVSVADHLKNGGTEYAYRIELTPVKPALTMGLPERQQYVDVSVSVPAGNRVAALVSAARADFGGDLTVGIANLPAGVSIETLPMAANMTIVPVLFTAPAGTAPAGTLADVIGKPVDPNLAAVEGHLSQTTGLVRGQNNIVVWGHTADRMAIAVTEEAPFSIEIVQPKVPLVRDGAMNLKVVATRKEGFTAPIAISMLYDPPGVGSARSIAIAEGQTEAVIPLNANGGAEIKTWKIAVTGQATVGNGPVLVSSQLADLEIADRYFTFAFDAAAVEQGAETEVVVRVTKVKDFEGSASVELLGLPNEVTTTPIEINKDTTEAAFKIKTTVNSPEGKHQTLLCRAIVTLNGEPVTHSLGTGQLRIDKPLPPKVDAPPPMPVAVAAPMPAAAEAPPVKRLTRLEQLRLDREKAKQAAEGAPAEAAPAETPPAGQ
ncbi:MAG: PPC domain-containing protein [Pirellulales bacterium]